MKKYPVTSKSGATYRVIISEEYSGLMDWKVRVQIRREHAWRMFRWKTVREAYDWNIPSGIADDYIRIAKTAVADYEAKIEHDRNKAQQKRENVRRFEEWDGDCR